MICQKCGHDLQVGDFPFCKGQPYQHAKGYTNVIGDEMDHVQVNGLKQPQRFRSKSEHRRWLKEKALSGWYVDERHGETGGKEWLAKAEELATRHGGIGTKEPEDTEPLHVTFTSGDATPDMVEHYRSRSR